MRAKFGFDRIKFMVTGSAPIADECLLALRVIFGCPVAQGLGLSETGGGICCSFFQDNATVGHCGGIICCAEERVGKAKACHVARLGARHGISGHRLRPRARGGG